ncbi:hypothetical protein M0805_004418 [Coniferiporia weirii]|nr:hypothetical protein M0805_004418 [Coniferiporia weirii]
MASYVDHIVEQIQHNVGFLVSQGHMTQQDADLVLSRLPSDASPVQARPLLAAPAQARRGVQPPPPPSRLPQARAVWAYNENGQDPDDLSFSPGDVIEIVEETNDDWWMGKYNGKQGLFPSNHVEKLSTSAPTGPAPAAPVRAIHAPPPQYDQPAAVPRGKVAYRPFGAAHHGTDKPPPVQVGAVNSVGLQEAEGQDKKKSKYGKLGNTMAHSAAGGVGFGAGAAIGGGLVRAIF